MPKRRSRRKPSSLPHVRSGMSEVLGPTGLKLVGPAGFEPATKRL